MELSDSQLLSCRKAAARFYRAGGRYQQGSYQDIQQNAILAALKILMQKPTLQGKTLETFIVFRLIDEYRKETGCRYLRRHGRDSLRFYSNAFIDDRKEDKLSNNPLTEKSIKEWSELVNEKYYKVRCNDEAHAPTITISETALHTALARTLRGSTDFERKCVNSYFFAGSSMRETGKSVGRCESRVSQVIKNFTRRLRAALLQECMGE